MILAQCIVQLRLSRSTNENILSVFLTMLEVKMLNDHLISEAYMCSLVAVCSVRKQGRDSTRIDALLPNDCDKCVIVGML